MFKFENEVDAKLAIYEACMNGEITEAQKDSLMMSLNKKLGKVLLEKIKSGMKFKYAGDTYIAKGSVTYQTVSGVKIPTLKVQKEDGTVTNLQFDPEEDKAVRLVKESADETGNCVEFDAFIESVNADTEYLTEAANAAGIASKIMNAIKATKGAVTGVIGKAKAKAENKKAVEDLEYVINGLEGCAQRLEMTYNIYKKTKDEGKESAEKWYDCLSKEYKSTHLEIQKAITKCTELINNGCEAAKAEFERLEKIEKEFVTMADSIGLLGKK